MFAVYTDPLDRLGLSYFVTGSVASMVYGEPRMTHDVDLVLALGDGQVAELLRAFPEETFYRPPADVIRIELRRPAHGHFNLIHHDTGFKADVYLIGRDPLHQWAMSRRRRIGAGAGTFWVAPPEYVIVRKLEYFREGGSTKHLRDVAAMTLLSGDELDTSALQEWIGRLGLEREWARVAEAAP